MHPPHDSPILELVSLWRSCREPQYHEVNACRARLFEAATREIAIKASLNIIYNPLGDIRFLWANQWIDLASGARKAIDPEIEACCAMMLQPAPLSRKHLAAADHSAA